MIKISHISFALMALTGCTEHVTNWQQPGLTEAQWADDSKKCLSWSRRQAEKDMESGSGLMNHNGTDNSFRQFMSSYDTGRSQKKLMKLCLRQHGYSPTPENSEK
ncbi:MAG: hypothetical protein ACKVG1_02295 [Rhodospirillales bacterium]|jgi:hypothetical protein